MTSSDILAVFLFMAVCYIIYSEKLDWFYTGACQGELQDRISKHNDHGYGLHRFTAVANDWKLFLEFEAEDYAHAIRIERKIKSMKSSKYIRDLTKYQELRLKLIETTDLYFLS